jgi:protein gp37
MSDLFHDSVPTDFVKKVWAVMEVCPQHQFQVLTKRPERLARFFRDEGLKRLPHVWIGTSVEGRDVVDRISQLTSIRGMTRFVSFEPLIDAVGDIDLKDIHWAIVGGESGPNARPMLVEWVEQIERACRKAGTAFFFKQWGGVNKKRAGRELRGRTYDEYPEVVAA